MPAPDYLSRRNRPAESNLLATEHGMQREESESPEHFCLAVGERENGAACERRALQNAGQSLGLGCRPAHEPDKRSGNEHRRGGAWKTFEKSRSRAWPFFIFRCAVGRCKMIA